MKEPQLEARAGVSLCVAARLRTPHGTFKQAQRVRQKPDVEQHGLDL